MTAWGFVDSYLRTLLVIAAALVVIDRVLQVDEFHDIRQGHPDACRAAASVYDVTAILRVQFFQLVDINTDDGCYLVEMQVAVNMYGVGV